MRRPAKADWRHLASLFFDTFLLQNIVLIQAVGICPIIGAGVNLKYGVTLTVCTAAVLLPTSLCMSLFGEKIPSWLRPPVYTVGASLLLLLAAFILDSFISHRYLRQALPLSAADGGQYDIHLPRGRLLGGQPAGSRAHRRLRLRLWVRAGGMHRLLPARNCHQQHHLGHPAGHRFTAAGGRASVRGVHHARLYGRFPAVV